MDSTQFMNKRNVASPISVFYIETNLEQPQTEAKSTSFFIVRKLKVVFFTPKLSFIV